jgi:hypothetical protein
MNSARANKENGDWEIIKKYYVDCTTYLYLLEFLTSGSKSGTHTHTILMERDWEIRICIVFICYCFLFQVVLNTGGDQYQTVTIVPSDGNTGEVCKIIFLIFHLFSNV